MSTRASIGCLLLALFSFSPSLAASGRVASAFGTPDAHPVDQVWAAFHKGGKLADIYLVERVAAAVTDEDGETTLESCAEHQDLIRRALNKVPVSLSLWIHAGRCADLLGDRALAQQTEKAAAALLQQAVAIGRAPAPVRPVPVVAQADVSIFAELLGKPVLQAYYDVPVRGRYLDLVLVVGSPDGGTEERWRFDFLDTTAHVALSGAESDLPLAIANLGDRLIGELAGNPGTESTVALALLKADRTPTMATRRKALLDAAALSDDAALLVGVRCVREPPLDCAEEGIDLLIPGAEKPLAIAYVALAYAYATGRGIGRDDDAARKLLAAANRRMGGAHGSLLFQSWWRPAYAQPRLHPLVADELRRAAARDPLAAHTVALASGHWNSHVPPEALPLLRRAAAAGIDEASGYLGLAELERGKVDDGLRALRAAARAGAISIAYRLGGVLLYDPQVRSNRAEAERWLRMAAAAGDVGAQLALARQLERADEEGISADLKRWINATLAGGYGTAAYAWTQSLADPAPALLSAFARVEWGVRAVLDEGRTGSVRKALWAGRSGAQVHLKYRERARQLLRAEGDRGDVSARGLYASNAMWQTWPETDRELADRWLQEALDAQDEETVVNYASSLFFLAKEAGDIQRALSMWESLWERQGSTRALNELAWARCSSSLEEVYAPAQALALAQALDRAVPESFGAQDTVAACLAAGGEFRRAAELQARLVARLRPESGTAHGARIRLQAYRAGKPYRASPQQALLDSGVLEP